MPNLAGSERAELCRLMLEVGPEAPTLNQGWVVLDLAAHLVTREHDLWAAPGIIWGGPFVVALDVAMGRRRRQGLARLATKLAKGDPIWWRRVPRGVQLTEYYIHHEDVRRANGMSPRTDRPDLDGALRRLLPASTPVMLRGMDVGVELVWNDDVIISYGDEPHARLTGPPGELMLYLSGRRSAAEVAIEGDTAAVTRLGDAELGL